MNTKRVLSSIAAAACLLGMSAQARADYSFTILSRAHGYVGSLSNGNPVIVYQDQNMNCHVDALGGGAGLGDNTFLQLSNFPGFDDVVFPVLSGTVSWCGRTLKPLVTRGFSFSIRAGVGNDIVANGKGRGFVNGQDGNDWISPGYGSNNYAYGGNGNDLVQGVASSSTEELWGEGQDDVMCSNPSFRIARISGDLGWDQCCGNATQFAGCDLDNCPVCGYGN